jgi:hypothetical protein
MVAERDLAGLLGELVMAVLAEAGSGSPASG